VNAYLNYYSQGLGTPVFDKLEAELAKACMSLPATKGFEFGSGFAGIESYTFLSFVQSKINLLWSCINHTQMNPQVPF